MNKTTATTGVKELSNIHIDFESALEARKNARNTYRKYAHTKKWETSLRKTSIVEHNENTNIAVTAKNTLDPIIGLETESTLASRAFGRSMPPPPSPIPQTALDCLD